MTTKEKFDKILDEKKIRKKFLYLLTGSVFFLNLLGLAVSSPNEKEAIPTFFTIIMLLVTTGFTGPAAILFIKLKTLPYLKKVIVCPSCEKSLSYLVTDPNYTNKYFSFELPQKFPEDVTHCPFCKFNLMNEER